MCGGCWCHPVVARKSLPGGSFWMSLGLLHLITLGGFLLSCNFHPQIHHFLLWFLSVYISNGLDPHTCLSPQSAPWYLSCLRSLDHRYIFPGGKRLLVVVLAAASGAGRELVMPQIPLTTSCPVESPTDESWCQSIFQRHHYVLIMWVVSH